MRGKKTEMVLQRRTESVDTQGAVTETWEDIRRIKGILTSSPSSRSGVVELYSKDTEVSTHYFLIDFPYGITISTEDRFRNDTDFYDILYIANPASANRHLELHLRKLIEIG